MIKNTLKVILLASPFIAGMAHADSVNILNHNFEFDAIPTEEGQTDRISGWVSSGFGDIGVIAPSDGSMGYNMIDGRAQIAFLEHGGRISQTVSAILEAGETYTLHYDVGQQNGENNPNFVARIKVNGSTIAQLQSNETTIVEGEWQSLSFDVTATADMPIGHPIVLEFANLAKNGGRQVDLDNVYLMTAGTAIADPGTDPVMGPGAGMSAGMIIEDMTLNVPEDHANIVEALNYLTNKRIQSDKTVTISVNNCTNQNYAKPIKVSHPNGENIHIIGASAPANLCRLNFGPTSNGFVVSNNNTVGLIDGFNMVGTFGFPSSGVLAQNGATVNLGESMRVAGFLTGVHAERNSTIIADGVNASSNTQNGFLSDTGSFIQANDATASFNGTNGFVATQTGSIDATGTTTDSNAIASYRAARSGYINASHSTTSGFIPFVFQATSNGHVNAFNVTFNGNNVSQQDAQSHGVITEER